MTIHRHGHEWLLLPEKAVYWPSQKALIIADCHLGKTATFRHHGLAVPEGGTEDDLGRISHLIRQHDAEHLIVAGDLFHAPTGWTEEVMTSISKWREQHPALRWTLVVGNHDRALHRLPSHWRLEVTPHLHLAGVSIIHDPDDAADEPFSLCGHWHPTLALSTNRRLSRLRAPIFWLRPEQLILPAFGSFTGGKVITPEVNDEVYAISQDKVLPVPAALWGG